MLRKTLIIGKPIDLLLIFTQQGAVFRQKFIDILRRRRNIGCCVPGIVTGPDYK